MTPTSRPSASSAPLADLDLRTMVLRPAALTALVWLAAFPAWGQSPAATPAEPPPHQIVLTDLQAAQLLIASGHGDKAVPLLRTYLTTHPDDSEALFLLADIAVSDKRYDEAIADYRRILVREPDVVRVRLELARAFFLNADYDNADRQFRFARAGDIPDAVKANIDTYLSAINRLREWTFNFAFALVPDSNENAATGVSQIAIYGLPFALDSRARSHSGVGAMGEVGGEWSPLLSDNVKARLGADTYRVDYGGGAYDDMTISTYAGPQFLFPDWDVSLLGSGFQRWYANKVYMAGEGGKLQADYGITSDLLIGVSFGAQHVRYKDIPLQDGPLFSTQLQGRYVVSPSSSVQLQAGFNRQDARIGAYSYNGYFLGAGYSQDLPFGFSAGLQPSYLVTHYDAPLLAFGKTRVDNAASVSVTLLNRRFDYHGFTPRFSYSYTDQKSNIPLYRYSRSLFQLGLTSQF